MKLCLDSLFEIFFLAVMQFPLQGLYRRLLLLKIINTGNQIIKSNILEEIQSYESFAIK